VLALWSPQADPTRVFEPAARADKVARATMLEQVVERFQRPDPASPFAAMKRAVAAQYSKSFTPIDRAIKKGSDLDRARKALKQADEHRSALDRRRKDLADKVAAYQNRSHRHDAD